MRQLPCSGRRCSTRSWVGAARRGSSACSARAAWARRSTSACSSTCSPAGPAGCTGLARGPFSLELHRNLILALERQRFPDKTPNEADRWKWVHCEVTAGREATACDIVTPDVAGEAVLAELENPKSNPTIRSLIGRCAGLVVLVDILQVIADGQGQELFAMQLISYLDSLRPPSRNRKIPSRWP